MSKKILILLGPPGSGKGTQAAFLANILHIPVVSTGNVLRRECETATPLGASVEAILRAGELVPDDVMNHLICRRVSCADCQDGFVLDGYPRTVGQAVYLDSLLDRLRLPRPEVVVIDVPPAQLISRLAVRWQCPACGRSYNDRHWAPAHRGFCDDDGMPLVRRSDDAEPTIRERIRQYAQTSRPILEHYQGPSLHRVDGRANPGTVLEAVETALSLYAVRS